MPGLSAWAVRRPVIALIAWFVALVAIVGLGVSVGGTLNDKFDLPDTESKTATDLLASSGTDTSRLDGGATIVWSPATGSAVDPAVAAQVQPVLASMADLASVACITTPFDPAIPAIGSDCPKNTGPDAAAMKALTPEEQKTLAASFSSVSPDGTVAYSTITFATDANGDVNVSGADAKAILGAVKALNSDTIAVGAQGSILEFAGQEPPKSEGVGLIFAIVILLIAFGSVVAVGMPIVPALLGLTMGQMGVLLVANFMDVATFAPTLAAMIGLGVGIDYGLFVMNRFRQGLLHGHDAKFAAMEAVNTAGRAVLFAGIDGDHRPARPVRDAHLLLQRPVAGGRRDGPVRHAVRAVVPAGDAQPAGHEGDRVAAAVGQEARLDGRAPGGQGLGPLRPHPAEAPPDPRDPRARRGDRPRHPDVQPAAGVRRRLRQARGLARAHRLRPAGRGLRPRRQRPLPRGRRPVDGELPGRLRARSSPPSTRPRASPAPRRASRSCRSWAR